MAGKPIVTIGSMHVCPMCTGTVPHVGGPIAGPGAPNVLINGKAVALMGDICTCIGPPDVVAQGNPLVKVNGVPVVCQGDLTAHGGIITSGEPNVTISAAVPTPSQTMPKEKIPFPKITIVNRTISAFSGNSLNEAEANQKKLANLAEETPITEDSTTVTLTTTYPQEQLQKLVSFTPLHRFLEDFITIYGKDIPARAYEHLYKDIKDKNEILNPILLIKQSIPYGGKALFYTNKKEDKKEIWVDEAFVIEATTNNDTSGELMVALVEEYGHWLDYLLRNHYAETEREDALRDEGAYFSYRMLQLNSLDQQDQIYADATVNGAEHTLLWDYEPYHKGLKAYVDEERWFKDDHFGSFEFYKAGFLKKDEGEYAHGNIEQIALEKSLFTSGLVSVLSSEEQDNRKGYLLKIYFGNWKRDFSQGLDPLVTRVIANALKAFANESNLEEETTFEESLNRFTMNRLKTDTVRENEEVTYKFPLLGFNIAEVTFKPVEVSVKVISTMLEMLAAKEFIYQPLADEKYYGNVNYSQYLEKLKTEFSPVNKDEMGVYIPAEHIDNPKPVGEPLKVKQKDGSITYKANDDKEILKEFIGIDAQNEPLLHEINTEFGMKNYIRNSNTGAGKRAFNDPELPNRYLYSHTYILDQLKKASKKGGYDKQECKDSLGAALHTLEDFFAHSNYAELALIKEGAYGVFPWVTKVTLNGEDKIDYLKYIKDYTYKAKVNNNPKKYNVVENVVGINNSNQLVTKLPLVTGTFGLLDTAASLLPIVAHAFDYDEKKSAKEIEKSIEDARKEEHGSFYYAHNVNGRSFVEVLALELLRDMTNETEGDDSIVVKGFLTALTGRDYMYEGMQEAGETAKSIYDMFPDLVKEALEEAKKGLKPVVEKVVETKDDVVELIMAPIYNVLYSFITMIASNINDVQVLQQSQITNLEMQAKNKTWDLQIGMDPTHTQIAKDDPHHPMHTLSAVLSIEAVERIGTKVFNAWLGKEKEDFASVESELNDLLRHPAQTTWQSNTVKNWMKDTSKHKEDGIVSEISNRSLICKASSPSVAIDRLLHVNEEIKETLKTLDNVAKQSRFKKTNETVKMLYNTARKEHESAFKSFEDYLTGIRDKLKVQDKAITKLQIDWDTQFPESLYCRMDTAPILYHVKRGDTLYGIAEKGNTSIEDLLELNPFIDPETKTIYAGTDIKVPYPILDINLNTNSFKG